jgi:hypothetical protein
MDDVQRATASGRGVVLRDTLGFPENPMPEAAARNENSGGEIILHFLPSRLGFLRSQAFLKDSQAEGIAEFEPVERGERQRQRVGLPPCVRLGRIGIGGVKREEETGAA